MTPTERLVEEHTSIKVMLRVLETAADKLARNEAVAADDLERMIEFITQFGDRCHHAKEEDHLFPEMEKTGIPRNGGPVGVMLHEHEIGRGHVRGMKAALEAYRQQNASAAGDLVAHAHGYVDLLRGHIEKENSILYPMADARLSAEQQEHLAREFDRIDRDETGEEQIRAFHSSLDVLAAKYLS